MILMVSNPKLERSLIRHLLYTQSWNLLFHCLLDKLLDFWKLLTFDDVKNLNSRSFITPLSGNGERVRSQSSKVRHFHSTHCRSSALIRASITVQSFPPLKATHTLDKLERRREEWLLRKESSHGHATTPHLTCTSPEPLGGS